MTISDEVKVIGIDSDEIKRKAIIALSKLGLKKAVVINLHYLNDFPNFTEKYPRFKELMENRGYFKILYSEIEDDVKNLPSSNGWRARKDILYAGEKLEFNVNIIRSYWNWISQHCPI